MVEEIKCVCHLLQFFKAPLNKFDRKKAKIQLNKEN